MWLSNAKIPAVASAIVRSLVGNQLIETEAPHEVQQDVVAVLEQYVRDEQDITKRAREIADRRGASGAEIGRLKRELAQQRGIELGENAIDYLLLQLVEMLMNSHNVDEIFAEDHQLKLAMRKPLRDEHAASEQLEETLRKRMKHVEEGSSRWEIEYQRLREEVSRRRG